MEHTEPKWVFRLWSQQFYEESQSRRLSISSENSPMTPTSPPLTSNSPKIPRSFNTYSPGLKRKMDGLHMPVVETKTSRLTQSTNHVIEEQDLKELKRNTIAERPKKKSQKYKVAMLSDLSVSVAPFLLRALGLPNSVELNLRVQKILRVLNYSLEITTLKGETSNLDKELKRSEGFLLIFEYHNPSSLKELDHFVERLAKVKKSRNLSIVIVGIQSSMISPLVSEDEAQLKARQLGYPLYNINMDNLEADAKGIFVQLANMLDNKNAPIPKLKATSPTTETVTNTGKKELVRKESFFQRATSLRPFRKDSSVVV